MRLAAAQSEDQLKKNLMKVDVMIELSANAATLMKPEVDSLFRPSPQDPQLVASARREHLAVARGRGGLVRAHDESLSIGPVVACPSIATLANIRHSFERAVPKVLFATSSTQYALGSPFGYGGSSASAQVQTAHT